MQARRGLSGLRYLPISGGVLTGPLVAADGTAAIPGVTFAGDRDTGLYLYGTHYLGVTANGSSAGYWGAAGIGVNGGYSLGAGYAVGWATRSNLRSTADGKLQASNNANSAGVVLDASGGAWGFRNLADSDYGYGTIKGLTVTNNTRFAEVSAPSGVAGNAVAFARDNGSGKTQFCVVFETGAVQVLATEP